MLQQYVLLSSYVENITGINIKLRYHYYGYNKVKPELENWILRDKITTINKGII